MADCWREWWSKRTSKALYYVPAWSAVLAVPPALVCFFGLPSLTIAGLSLAVFLIFLGTGPVNAATLNAVQSGDTVGRDGGTVADHSSVRRYVFAEDYRDDQRSFEFALWAWVYADRDVYWRCDLLRVARYAPKLHSSIDADAIAAV